MKASDAIRERRSIKRYAQTPVSRDQIERMLDAATHAPNHRLTQPWRFYVLGPDAREAYGRALGERKAKKNPDPAKGAEVRETVAAEHRNLPGMIAVAVIESADPEQRDEDYAATMMAISHMMLVAVELGLGTAIKTGAIMGDPAARAAVGLPDTERIIAVINVGVPAEIPPAKSRTSAAALTQWRD